MKVLTEILGKLITKEIIINYLKEQIDQMTSYLIEKKGYPKDYKDLFNDLKEAFMFALLHGK